MGTSGRNVVSEQRTQKNTVTGGRHMVTTVFGRKIYLLWYDWLVAFNSGEVSFARFTAIVQFHTHKKMKENIIILFYHYHLIHNIYCLCL